ncbi:hypothetical protein [Streptomyces sp. R33]|uniref:Uncharacterized protein n=1 Tax=Streptomyces sp. R33 TaxID=3238629 RepID=A0AB39YFC8_9ACTN
MAKKKTEAVPGLTPVQADDTTSSNGEQPAPAGSGLVLTSVPQTRAADAREELLKAIASEATAISAAKDKGKSSAALEALARAYTLVATGQPQAINAPVATRAGEIVAVGSAYGSLTV